MSCRTTQTPASIRIVTFTMFTMYRPILAALTLVGLFNGSAQAAGIRNDRLFGQGQVFEPTQDLVGEPSDSARQVQDVNHCYEADFSLFFPGKTLIALDNDVSQLIKQLPFRGKMYNNRQSLNYHYASIIRGYSRPSTPPRIRNKVPVTY